MSKTILLTGATDGIGFVTAQRLASAGHTLLLHGRSADKLARVQQQLEPTATGGIETFQADLSSLRQVADLAEQVSARGSQLDVLINNAGVFELPQPRTSQGHDLRFIVNTVAPYLLTQRLLPSLPTDGRIVNLSSAAQARVDLDALWGRRALAASDAYAQSKLAITMWTVHLARWVLQDGPAVIAVNPASLLGSKMVKDAYGTQGKDLGIGAKVLERAATDPAFANASGRYFDNDSGRFASPHPDALDDARNRALVTAIEQLIAEFGISVR